MKPLFFILLLMSFISTSLRASHEQGSVRLSYPNVAINSGLMIQDNKYPLISTMPSISTWGFYDKSMTNKIVLGINRYGTVALPDFVATVTVQISSTAPLAMGGATTVFTKILSVSYEGANNHQAASANPSVDLSVFSFANGYKVTAQLLNVAVTSSSPSYAGTTMPSNVYLQLETDAERFYNLTFNASPFSNPSNVNIVYIPASDEFEISWARINGAEQYDLEWLWLDQEKNAFWSLTSQIDFRNNSTRVRTSQQSYRISNVFEKGQVFFRLRGVGKSGLTINTYDKDAYTPWSWQDLTTVLPSSTPPSATVTSVSSAPNNGNDYLFYITLDGTTIVTGSTLPPPIHEYAKNWQYKATYAEEGKKKEVISYFDGSLRSRQSVTKNNSDNNAIVGETYYDYNGRAAVQALPVPVADATIKFYQYNVSGQSAFNVNILTGLPYTKTAFDEDAASGSLVCAVVAAGLDPAYGSSNYYSDQNINQQFAQGYVPNAENFPISQTEYTNDNTGRIAKQGGVGINHQLGSGHETKYFYGEPEQIELDRLFGSEVGYNKHYKKNMVVDANGQVSISYIDQEGRTIATALSAQGPANLSPLKNTAGTILYSAPTTTNVLDADLLNKANAAAYDTEYDNNKRIGDELTFTKKILVPTAGTYTISYGLQGTAFTYSCLPANACYDCVYDLEINVYDNCMNNPPGFTKITQTLGNILPPSVPNGASSSTYSLDAVCNQTVNFSTSQLSYAGDHLLVNLQQGDYTISKTLRVNQNALSFYLDDYLKSNCVKKISDFQAGMQPDTSGCNLTCDACIAALGTQTAYVSAGKGTAADWLEEYQVCIAPCEYVSICDAEYMTMLADVSPGGQYGDWEDNNGGCNTSLYNLSVYNEANLLPTVKNFSVSAQPPHWRNPMHRSSVYTNTVFTPQYKEEDGTLSKVFVTKTTATDFMPPVIGSAVPVPFISGSTGIGDQFTVKPQDLANVCDFIANWKNSWAASLVFYHPEYPYYDWCLKNSTMTVTPFPVTIGTGSTTTTNSISTSDNYDSLMLVTDNVVGLLSGDLTKLCNPFTYDPYWTTNGYYYTNTPNPTTAVGTKVPQYISGGGALSIGNPWSSLYKNASTRYSNYLGSGVSLPAFVGVITTSCAIQYGQAIGAQLNCLMGVMNTTPGGTISSSVTINGMSADQILARIPTNLQNKYWDNFRMMYMAMKQQMQQEAAESYAMNGDYRGCNDAIGDPSFDPMALQVPFTHYYIFGPFSTFPGSGSTFFTNFYKQWFFPFPTANAPQYSNLFTGSLYHSKIKRFPNAKNATDLTNSLSTGDPGASIYASTGLCPNAFYFQNLLSAMGINNQLTSATVNLSAIPEFNKDLYTVVSNSMITSSFTPANWTASSTALSLSASMQIGANPSCSLNLTFPSGYPFNFSNTGNGGTYAFLKLYHLVPGTTSGGASNFTIRADVALTSGASQTFTTVTLTGSTCIPLTGCSFTPPCEPTTNAIALQKLMNAIAATGNMCSGNVLMSNPSIQPYFLNSFGPLLGAGGNWQWQVNGAVPNFVIKDISGTFTNSLTVSFSSNPCTAGSTFGFANITGNNSASNAFNINIKTVPSGSATVNTSSVTGAVNLNGQPLQMGSCGFDIAKCNTVPHMVREDFEVFLTNNNTRPMLQLGSANLTPTVSFGLNLRNQLSAVYQTYNSTALTTNALYYYWKQNAASTATLLTGSFLASTLTTVPATLTPAACGFTLSFAPTATLSGQSLLSPNAYSLSNFVLAPGPIVNTSVYDFSVTATFGSTPFVLNGTSGCFGMRSCSECVSPVGGGSSYSAFMMNDFPCTEAPTYAVGYGNPLATYINTLTPCSGTPTISDNNYTIQSFGTFDTGTSNLASYDGSSLYWKNNVNNDFNKYRQNFTAAYNCDNAKISFKVKDLSGSVVGTPYVVGDFTVKINGVTLTTATSSALSGAWTEFSYGTFSVNVSQTFSVEISPISYNDRYLIMDEVQLILSNSCLQTPCVTVADTLVPFPEVEYEDPCVQYALDAASNEAQELYNAYIDSMKNEFVKNYVKKCMGQAIETMYMKYNAGDYHFTLYYYDQAGNLVRTVPPEGVKVETSLASLNTIKAERVANTPYASKTYYTTHKLYTTYTYNGLNQLVKQQTPDAGASVFWYDALGRLVASQNSKQKAKSTSNTNYYSYTKYDYLGRIEQVGEMVISQDFVGMTVPAVAALTSVGNYPDNLTSIRYEVTSTYYGDNAGFTPLVTPAAFTAGSQQYLRSRVASVTIEDTYDGNAATYNHGTHYSYDVHGNVKELLQENKDITLFSYQQIKKMNYGYDLISGKVNEVAYQRGLSDMFLHRYEYDADNRITAVYTSKDNIVWDRDAKYFYYLHGPLARMETGQDKVQGTDYAYTLHGWIKGVNGPVLNPSNDIGKDALKFTIPSSGNLNSYTGKDIFGYSLTYYEDKSNGIYDYQAINGITGIASADFIGDVYSAGLAKSPDLFNGNIRQMASSYADASAPGRIYATAALLRNFYYDQLNRIVGAEAISDKLPVSNRWSTVSVKDIYKETFTYDQNGNILKANRNGNKSGLLPMDKLDYYYYANTNKLEFVKDGVSGDPYTTDISSQSTGNYGYDAIGNLIKDTYEGIANIDWTVYGKIKKILFTNGKPNIVFKYDASGNRVSKTTFLGAGPTSTATTTYYVRDAQGNVMATYEQKPNAGVPQFSLTEKHIYGSSRLGLEVTNVNLTSYSNTPVTASQVTRTLNFKSYELSNHLGNVMAVVSDRKIAVSTGAAVLPYQSYLQDFSVDFNGWTVVASTLSLDLGRLKVTSVGANGGAVKILPTVAGKTYTLNFDLDMGTTGGTMIGRMIQNFVYTAFTPVNGLNTYTFVATADDRLALYSPASGTSVFYVDNVKLTTTVAAIDYFTGEVLSANDYYAFGSTMPGRNFTSGSKYRYGMNSQEKDDEIGEGIYTAEFWQYDSRLGRRWNLDPKPQKSISQYACFANSPIHYSDINGDCPHGDGCTCGGGFDDPPEPSPAGLILDAYLMIDAAWYNTWQRMLESGYPVPATHVKRRYTRYTEDGGIIGNETVIESTLGVSAAEGAFDAVLDAVSIIPGKPNTTAAKALLFSKPVLTKPVVVQAVKGAIHHIFTNKNYKAGEQWSKKFDDIFSKAGYDLKSKLNQVFVEGHFGPHPAEYHKAVFDRILEATEGLKGKDYIKAFEKTLDILAKEVSTKGTKLNGLITK